MASDALTGGAPPSPRPRRPSFATRRQAWSALALVLLAVIAGVVWDRLPQRGGPEIILNRAAARLYLRGQRAYVVDAGNTRDGGQGVLAVTAIPLDGRGSPTTFRRITSDWRPAPGGNDTLMSGDELLCFAAARAEATPISVSGITDAEWKATQRLPRRGDYLLVPRDHTGRAGQGERRFRVVADRGPSRPQRLRGGPRLTLLRVPLDGREMHAVTLDNPGVMSGVVLGGALLWHDFRSAPVQGVISRAGVRYEFPATDRLMASPLDGGPAWPVAAGITAVTPLGGGERGIFWGMPRAYPDRRWDLHFLTADDIAARRLPHILPDYAGDMVPEVFHGRLYWIEHRPRAGGEEDVPRVTLPAVFAPGIALAQAGGGIVLRARLDGSDRRTVLAEGLEPGLTLQTLWVDRTRDRLYVAGTSAEGRPGSDFVRQRSFVARVPEEGAHSLGARLTLPETILGGPLALDDGYVYFSNNVPRHGLGATLADLFSQQTTRADKLSLCRMALPE